jgi:hypothetical protein
MEVISKLFNFHTPGRSENKPTFTNFNDFEHNIRNNIYPSFKDFPDETRDILKDTNQHDQFIWFYTPWCKFCKPCVEKWYKLHRDKKNLSCKIRQVDCEKHKYLRQHFIDHVPGFPTFIYVSKNGTIKNFSEFSKVRSAENFCKFCLNESQF